MAEAAMSTFSNAPGALTAGHGIRGPGHTWCHMEGNGDAGRNEPLETSSLWCPCL